MYELSQNGWEIGHSLIIACFPLMTLVQLHCNYAYAIMHKQYVRQTKNTLATRFYSHFFNVRHQKTTDGVGLHFSRSDHKGTLDTS